MNEYQLLGGLKRVDGPDLIASAAWYSAENVGDGLAYRFPAGTLRQTDTLTSDMLLDGRDLAIFFITLREGEDGPAFHARFGLLNQCGARMRLPLGLVDMNTWRLEREGAWLKPQTSGERVDLTKVDRMSFTVERKCDRPVRWCMTPITLAPEPPARMDEPVLPKGELIDAFGQSTIHDWPTRTQSETELTQRLQQQLADAPAQQWPESFSKWGGWKAKRYGATGFFATHFDGTRWWLTDPEGYAFFSAGLDCVRGGIVGYTQGLASALTFKPDPDGAFASIYGNPPSIDYLKANFIRAFGKEDWYANFAAITLGEMKRLGFNTVGNWSDWQIAKAAGFPYVIPMHFHPERVGLVFRDFPDVFDPDFERDAQDYARTLVPHADDPAMIGYFMMNEPVWAFSDYVPAEGMLYNAPACHTRRALADFLKQRHGSDEALAQAWHQPATFDTIAEGAVTQPFTAGARPDLEAFSEVMVDRFFKTLNDACRRVDKHHLNLGVRYYTVPPDWALKGMSSFDVFSMNCYKDKIPADELRAVHERLRMPVMIGEWHFGTLDAGLAASGIGHVRTQADRGRAYRVYLEDAAANPHCVGVHWFTLYDQSALGRFDGENYNIGFYDICNRPYTDLCTAARAAHEAMYHVAAGKQQPYSDAPEYLPRLFI